MVILKHIFVPRNMLSIRSSCNVSNALAVRPSRCRASPCIQTRVVVIINVRTRVFFFLFFSYFIFRFSFFFQLNTRFGPEFLMRNRTHVARPLGVSVHSSRTMTRPRRGVIVAYFYIHTHCTHECYYHHHHYRCCTSVCDHADRVCRRFNIILVL